METYAGRGAGAHIEKQLFSSKDVGKLEDDFDHLWSYYERKEIVDESTSVLKGLWKKIKAYKKIQDDPNYEKDDD